MHYGGDIAIGNKTKPAASTQENLEIAGVEDGIVILKDGSYRLVLDVTAVNFGLKSEREQNSIIFQFQGFLNSLHFPIEIVCQSRKLDLTPYLAKLRKRANKQPVELLKSQTLDYIDFVSELINMANIMKKRFYVIIGWENIEMQSLSLVDRLLNRGNSVSLLKISEKDFKTHGDELREKAAVLASNLGSIGLHCQQLTTGELIELFYNFYNPGIANKERMTDYANLESDVISSQQKTGFNLETPGNTSSESPIIDNTEYLKEQDKLRKQAEAVTKDRATALTPKTTPSEQATTVENVQSANTSAEQSTLAPVNTNQPKAN